MLSASGWVRLCYSVLDARTLYVIVEVNLKVKVLPVEVNRVRSGRKRSTLGNNGYSPTAKRIISTVSLAANS